MKCTTSAAGFCLVVAVAGCAAVPPAGPTVTVLPKDGKSYDAFRGDDAACRLDAEQSTGGSGAAAQAATNSAVGSAVLGTALGAAAGAALGSLGGAVGTGAAIGGVTGLALGGAVGANNAQASTASWQYAYDRVYAQCMAARGNQVVPPTYGYAPGYYPYSGYYGYGYPAYGPPVSVGVAPAW